MFTSIQSRGKGKQNKLSYYKGVKSSHINDKSKRNNSKSKEIRRRRTENEKLPGYHLYPVNDVRGENSYELPPQFLRGIGECRFLKPHPPKPDSALKAALTKWEKDQLDGGFQIVGY